MSEESKKISHTSSYVLFAIVVLGAAMGNLSQTSLNALMPTLASDFGISVDLAQWMTNIYILTLGIAVTITSYLTRRLGMRLFTCIALALFLAGSILSALAPGLAVMLVGRVLQGISTGFLMPLSQSIAMSRMPAGKQGTAMGIAGIAMGFAPNIGPTVGSLIAASLGWRAFFWSMGIIPLILFIIAIPALRHEERGVHNGRPDVWSFALAIIGFGGLLSGLSMASGSGFASPFTWVPLLIGALVLILFLRRQYKVANPLVHLSIMKSRRYVIGLVLQILLFGSFMGITLVIPLYVQGVLGGDSVDSGNILLPGAIVALIFNPLGGILSDKIGQVKVIKIGAVIYAVGSLLALLFDENTPLLVCAGFQCIRASGVSISIGPTLAYMLGELPRETVNDGSSFTILFRQASASFGTALMVLAVTAVGAITSDAMLPYQVSFGVSAVMGVALLILAFIGTKK